MSINLYVLRLFYNVEEDDKFEQIDDDHREWYQYYTENSEHSQLTFWLSHIWFKNKTILIWDKNQT